MIWFFRLLCLLLFTSTYSQIGGSTTFSFLNLQSSPRINALGGYSPLVIDDDPNLGLFNPALINSSMNSFVSVNYINYYSDINYGSIVFSPHFLNKKNLLFGINYVDYGTFEEADEFGNLIGSFKASEYLFSLGYSKNIYSDDNHFFNMGFNSKMGLSQLYSDFSLAFLVDVSLFYYNTKHRLNTSFLARNWGYHIVSYQDGNTEKLPFELVFSISNKLQHMPLRWSLTLQHLENWDLNFQNSNQTDLFLLNSSPNFGQELLRHVVLGLEFLITKNLNIRFGYNNRKRHEMMILDRKGMVGFSYGFSFK